MSPSVKPRDAKAVEEAVQWAVSEGKTLEIVGAGSKRAIGRPTQTDATLDLSGLSGITLYEPEELVLSARAGTPLKDIEILLSHASSRLSKRHHRASMASLAASSRGSTANLRHG